MGVSVQRGAGIGQLAASAVSIEKLATPTYADLQDMHDLARAAGHVDGGEITDAGGGNVNVAAGQGLVRAAANDTGTLFTFDWAAASGLAVPSNTIRYVQVAYNAGSPVVSLVTSESYDYQTAFPLGFVINEGGTLYINSTPHSIGRAVGRLSRRNYEVDGRSRANALGGLIISETGTKNIGVTAGTTWLRGLRSAFSAFDSSGTDRFDRYYRDGVGGFTREATQSALPLNTYDDGTGVLATVGNNNRANYWIYLGPSNAILLVYGRGDFNSLAAAQAESPPNTLPLRLQVGALLLGRFITLRSGGTSSVELVETAFTQDFTPAPVADHGNLAGLADDDHTQYHLRSQGVIRQVSAGTEAVTSGSVSFGDANGLSFGLNAGTLTGSYSRPVVSNAIQAVGSATGSGTNTSRFAADDHVHEGVFSAGVSTGGNTVGDTGVGPGRVVFQGGNNVTLSQVTAAGALRTVVISGGAGGGGDAIRGIAAGGSTATTNTVNFSNSNGISFGFGAAANSTVITGSHDGLTSQSNQALSGQNGSFTFQTASFSNANGISFGTSAGPALTASYTRPVVSNAIQAVGSATGSGTNTSRFAADDHVHEGVFSAGVSNLGNTAGDTGVRPGRLVLQGGNNITLSQATAAGSLQTVVVSASQSNQAFSAGAASSAFQTLSFQDSLNLSFSNNAGAVRVTHNLAGTSTGFAGANISGSMTHNSSGLNLSLSVAAPGGGGIAAISGGTTQATSGTVVFSNSNNVSFGVNGQTITATAAGGAAAQPARRWAQPEMIRATLSNVTTLTAITSRPFFMPYFHPAGDLTISRVNWEMSRSTSGSNHFTAHFGIYTYVNDTQISLLGSVSGSYSNTATASISGVRRFAISGLPAAISTLTPGGYVMGWLFNATATASINYFLRGVQTASPVLGGVLEGADQYNTATSYNFAPFYGRLTGNSANLPGSVADSQVIGQFSGASHPIGMWMMLNND